MIEQKVLFEGLTAGSPNLFDDVGTMSLNLQTNKNGLPGNIDPGTGQPPRCGAAGTTPLNQSLEIVAATTSASAPVINTSPDPSNPGFSFDQEADPSEGGAPMAIADIPDWYPLDLSILGIPFTNVVSRGYGIASIAPEHESVNILTVAIPPLGSAYATITIVGNPIVGHVFVSGNQAITTCAPSQTTMSWHGISTSRPWSCIDYFGNPVAACTPLTSLGGAALATVQASGTYPYEVLLAGAPNPDGDTTGAGVNLFNEWDNCRLTENGLQTPSTTPDNGIGADCNASTLGTTPPGSAPGGATIANASMPCDGSDSAHTATTAAPWSPCQDADADGVLNAVDDCPLVSDPTQADSQGDGIGDACRPYPGVLGVGNGYVTGAVPGVVTTGSFIDWQDACTQPFTVNGGMGVSSCVSVGGGTYVYGDPVIVVAGTSYTYADSNNDGIPDFLGVLGSPCVQDHRADSNHDGYTDGDEGTPHGPFSCSGVYPVSGGLAVDPIAACPGRAWNGTGTAPSAVKIAKADVDLNGRINILDLSQVAGVYSQSGFGGDSTDKRNEFDQDGNGIINILDLSAMAAHYSQLVPSC